MRLILALFVCVLLTTARAGEQTGSLLGKPVTTMVGSLDDFTIKVGQAKGTATIITAAAARYALEHSELLDPTLPEVRNNDYPLIAEVQLVHRGRTNEIERIDLCGGLGLWRSAPFTYVFRYRLPESAPQRKAGIAEPVEPGNRRPAPRQ